MIKFFAALLVLSSFAIQGFSQAPDGRDSILAKRSIEEKTDESVVLPPGFKSDGCSLFPDGNYRDCCVAHDIDYYKGGKGRRSSDKRLYRCVKKKKGWQNKFIAPLIFIGVRIGGVSFLPTPFRWGFGKKKMKRLEKEAQTEKTKDPPKDIPIASDKSNN